MVHCRNVRSPVRHINGYFRVSLESVIEFSTLYKTVWAAFESNLLNPELHKSANCENKRK